MNIQEILDLYDKTAFLPFGMAELLLEREAELVKQEAEIARMASLLINTKTSVLTRGTPSPSSNNKEMKAQS